MIGTKHKACDVRAARFEDIHPLIDLLGSCVPEVSPNTVWHLPWTWQHYRILEQEGQIFAAAALQPIDAERAEIRGVVVAQEQRGQGLAKLVIQTLVHQADENELEALCITCKPNLFRQFGFAETAPFWLDLPRRQANHSGSAHERPKEQRIAMVRPQWPLRA